MKLNRKILLFKSIFLFNIKSLIRNRKIQIDDQAAQQAKTLLKRAVI